jgi:hypothetical protein
MRKIKVIFYLVRDNDETYIMELKEGDEGNADDLMESFEFGLSRLDGFSYFTKRSAAVKEAKAYMRNEIRLLKEAIKTIK